MLRDDLLRHFKVATEHIGMNNGKVDETVRVVDNDEDMRQEEAST